MIIRKFDISDQENVINLWIDCKLIAPQNDPHKDIERKLKTDPELFLIGEKSGQIIASVMAGYEGHRGWINYLAVSPDHRKQQYGRKMMDAAQELLLQKGCPKINLQIRKTNRQAIEFYQSLGFTDDHVISLGKKIE